MSWSKQDWYLLATGSYDKLLFWDIRNTRTEQNGYKLGSQIKKVLFDTSDNTNVLLTLHQDQQIRVWDQRTLQVPLYIFEGHDQEIKNMEFDPVYGRLLMTQAVNQINVFRINLNSADFITRLSRERSITQAQWLPFGLGLAVHQEKADKVEFFQLIEKPTINNEAIKYSLS